MEEQENERIGMLTSEADIRKKTQKELSSVYGDIINLSNTVTGLLKGEEPNMQSLWGISYSKSEDEVQNELSAKDLGKLKSAVDSIRTNLCDYYAEKYSNECNIQ